MHSTPKDSRSSDIGLGMPNEESSEPDIRSFTLRVQKEVLEQVDALVSKHLVIRNRNTWIVNAIVEQIKRERQDQ